MNDQVNQALRDLKVTCVELGVEDPKVWSFSYKFLLTKFDAQMDRLLELMRRAIPLYSEKSLRRLHRSWKEHVDKFKEVILKGDDRDPRLGEYKYAIIVAHQMVEVLLTHKKNEK